MVHLIDMVLFQALDGYGAVLGSGVPMVLRKIVLYYSSVGSVVELTSAIDFEKRCELKWPFHLQV